jgi:L-lactate dehydrogenase complex protein LldE
VKVALFAPCFVDTLDPAVARAAVEVVERLGHEVSYPEAQTCCGQPAFNAGYWAEARRVAEHFVRVFAGAEVIVCPSASCTAMVRAHYPELLADSPQRAAALAVAGRTFELGEFLVERLGLGDVGARFAGRVVWHDGCHGLRELGIRAAPRRLLAAVRDLELVELEEPGERCCGFGGTFAVKHAPISAAMLDDKVRAIAAAGASHVASGDPSCLMQIGGALRRRGLPVRTIHLAQILASR